MKNKGRSLWKTLLSAGAAVLMLGLVLGFGVTAEAAETIAVDPDNGTVTADSTYDGPQVKKIRLLREGNFLEIYWDRYVDEDAAVNPSNFVFKAGAAEIHLTGNQITTTGSTDTLYFDRENKAVAATDAHCMDRLNPNLHMSSISVSDSEAKKLAAIGYDNLTLEIKGSNIKDDDGKAAKDAVYTGIPRLSFYSRFRTTKAGIIIKSDNTVKWSSLDNAAEQVDHELGKEGTGIAETMRKWNCSLAVYSPNENVYLIPEHRGGFNYYMYDVEGYGGSKYNDCVSSIAERNITRTRNNSDDFQNTKYPNENILIHEFGHCVRLIGIEEQADKTLSTEFNECYYHAKESGLWPNTYCIKNSDEFFATMCTVWFNVMAEKPTWNDGVRCPINTREELKKYDPQTYAFFAKILPEETLNSPWDEPAPDQYHEEYVDPDPHRDRKEADASTLESDTFRIIASFYGTEKHVDMSVMDEAKPEENLCLWWIYDDVNSVGPNTVYTWKIKKIEDNVYSFEATNGYGVMTATSTGVTQIKGSIDTNNKAQQWKFTEDTSTSNPYDGKLTSVLYGKELAYDMPIADGSILRLADEGKGGTWLLLDASQSAVSPEKVCAYLKPGEAPKTPEETKLTAPVIRKVYSVKNGVRVTWKKVSGASGYRIQRKASKAKTWKNAATVTGGSRTSWTDKKVRNGLRYQYRIRAIRGNEKSVYSKTAKTYYLKRGQLVGAKKVSARRVRLTWRRNKKATGYQIRCASNRKFTNAKKFSVNKRNTTTKLISSLKKGKTWYFSVRTVRKVNGRKYYSAWSAAKKVRLKK